MIVKARLLSCASYSFSILIFMSSAMTLEEQQAGWYPLHRLAERTQPQDTQRLGWLLSTGRYHVDQLENECTTPLMVACFAGNCASVKVLLKYGADPNLGAHMPPARPDDCQLVYTRHSAKNCRAQCDWRSPLSRAAEGGHLRVIQELIVSDTLINWPYVTDCDGNNILITALKNKRWRLVDWLLQTPERLILIRTKKKIDRSGENALMYAIRANSYPIVAALVDGGYRIPKRYQDKNAMIKFMSLKHVDSDDVRLLIWRLLVPYSVVNAIRKRQQCYAEPSGA